MGNLGAGPKPPRDASYEARNDLKASSNHSGRPSTGAEDACAYCRNASVIWPPVLRIFLRSSGFCQDVPICVTTSPHPGCPHRAKGGKYVPPKKGFRSGVTKTFKGQPPDPVIACTAVI